MDMAALNSKVIGKSLAHVKTKKLSNTHKLIILALLAAIAIALYMTVGVRFDNPKLFQFSMKIRAPKVIAMFIVAICIGGASMVFQSIINNTIVTPCLLGMNSLYTLIHTGVVFVFGSTSLVARNVNAAFAVDLFTMAVVATFIYSFLFRKTKYNILYVLLIGTVLSSFFASIQSTMIRVMDPNEYDALLSTLVASFGNMNTSIIAFSAIMMVAVFIVLRKDIEILDVITLGKNQAINLGVDYDRAISRLLLGVVLLIATATALVGPISFLGLIIANLSRRILQTYRHGQLVAGSVFTGMIALIGGQVIVEHVVVYAVPLSVFVSVIGGIYFLYLLLKQKGSV